MRVSSSFASIAILSLSLSVSAQTPARRLVILKIDGLNADLLYKTMAESDPATGRSKLPWLSKIFAENGAVFENFYTRGISLSAPSWSMLDTARHAVIRGNVEYDRFTGQIYDYLNFFPFYLGYARNKEVDMPGVRVLQRAGISLVIDRFNYDQQYQSFQLFQRGVRWTSLKHALERRFASRTIFSMIESTGSPSLDETLMEQTEAELMSGLKDNEILYLDFYTGDIDHEGHATNNVSALAAVLRNLDALAGRIWTSIQKSPLASGTLFVAVSDHGMNNVPGVFSQSFSLPDLFNSPAGGAHHVITNRHQLSDYKLMGLDPLVQRVITPSTASFYLAGEANRYPTAWLDLDGNERAAVHLRNSELNKIQIVLQQLARTDLAEPVRKAAVTYLQATLDKHRSAWLRTLSDLDGEMRELRTEIDTQKPLAEEARKRWTSEEKESGEDKAARRMADEWDDWKREYSAYTAFESHLRELLALNLDDRRPFSGKIDQIVPEMTLGENNSVRELSHYVAGPAAGGLVLNGVDQIDEAKSFRFVDYFPLLASQTVRNNPQRALAPRPIDFIAMRLPDAVYDAGRGESQHAYWLYGDDSDQLVILEDKNGALSAMPAQNLSQDENGEIHWIRQNWRAGLPLHLFEDPSLQLPRGTDAGAWLSSWHTEQEWLRAVHKCRYSNGIIGVTEELSPVEDNVPGPPGINPVLLRYEKRRRELVQADFHIFAADHWNFNVRNFNPGGNHGGFFRISTHSVWMMAGPGILKQQIEEPYDSLNFGSTVLSLLGKEAPLPERVVGLKPVGGGLTDRVPENSQAGSMATRPY